MSRLTRMAAADTTTAIRGQSEPLAALLSVAIVCLVISLYVGAFTDTLPALGEDRDVSDPTADAIWQEIRTDGAVDASDSVAESIDRSSLPAGYAVSVEIRTVDTDGKIAVTDSVQFDTGGEPSALDVPADTTTIERPVAVRLRSGDVRPGTLVVEVWE